jgi:hypothetical protein
VASKRLEKFRRLFESGDMDLFIKRVACGAIIMKQNDGVAEIVAIQKISTPV